MTGAFPPPSVSRPDLLDADGRDRAFRRMVYDLLTVGARMETVRDRLAEEMGVSGPQYAILMAIAHLEDGDAEDEGGGEARNGAGVRAVARRLHVSGPFITAQVNLLVDSGLVEKHPDPTDGRAVVLRLAPAGRAAVERTAPAIRRANDAFFAALGNDDFARLADMAERLVGSSEAAVEMFDADDVGVRRRG